MGDRVLKAIAEQLANSVRAMDCPARFGGEEFAVLLPDTPLNQAASMAERIRGEIKALKFDGWPEQFGPVTVSIGCASSPGKHSLDEILKAADDALYQAKARGRDRTISAAEIIEESELVAM